MPSLTDILSLRNLSNWLSGSSTAVQDTAKSPTKPKRGAKHGRLQMIALSSDMMEGKTFEEAMAAAMAAMPPSTTESEETDELADDLEATALSETMSSCRDSVSDNKTQRENEEEPPATDAALKKLNDAKPGCQCCDWAVRTEYAYMKTMQAAKSFGRGSTGYYEYFTPSHTFRCTWLTFPQCSCPRIPLQSQPTGARKILERAHQQTQRAKSDRA